MKTGCAGSERCYEQPEHGSQLGGGGRLSARPSRDSAQPSSRSLGPQSLMAGSAGSSLQSTVETWSMRCHKCLSLV